MTNSKKEGQKAAAAKTDQKKNEVDVNKTIEQFEKHLQEEIERSLKKKKLIDNRSTFLTKKEALNQCGGELAKDVNMTDLETKDFSITLVAGEYRGEKVITIKNKMIITEFIDFACKKIDTKVSELEKEIISI